jgi:hypothetical protein
MFADLERVPAVEKYEQAEVFVGSGIDMVRNIIQFATSYHPKVPISYLLDSSPV